MKPTVRTFFGLPAYWWIIVGLLLFQIPAHAIAGGKAGLNERARYLNPNTGRFWSMDLFEGHSQDPSSLHKFHYCQVNPVMGFDPSGHDDLTIGGLMCATGIGATIGAFSAAAVDVAHGRAITVASVVQGAEYGALFAIGGWAVPAVGVGLGAGGVLVGASFSPIILDPNATPGQKIAAATLVAAGAVGGVLTVVPLRVAPAEPTATLYRAISKDELADIAEGGQLRPGKNSMNNKWFAESAENAAAWGKKFFDWDKQPVWTLVVKVPQSVADKMMRNPNLDGIGPARSADGTVLDELNQTAEMKIMTGNIVPGSH
jgi:RHS repeat-associated protein